MAGLARGTNVVLLPGKLGSTLVTTGQASGLGHLQMALCCDEVSSAARTNSFIGKSS